MGETMSGGFLYGASSLISFFTQALILFSVFLVSGFIVGKIRFFLLGFFWKKKGFDVIAQMVLGFFYPIMLATLIDTLFVFLIRWGNINILSDTAVRFNIALLMFIVVIAFVVDMFIKPYIAKIDPETNISSLLNLGIIKTQNNEYVLYFNGSRVRKFETKEELIDFLSDVKNYLGSDMYKEALDFLSKD